MIPSMPRTLEWCYRSKVFCFFVMTHGTAYPQMTASMFYYQVALIFWKYSVKLQSDSVINPVVLFWISCLKEQTIGNVGSKWKMSFVTDWQPGYNDFFEEGLDDHGEVFSSVIPARLHKLIEHTLYEKRDVSAWEWTLQLTIKIPIFPTWNCLLSSSSFWRAFEFAFGNITQGQIRLTKENCIWLFEQHCIKYHVMQN